MVMGFSYITLSCVASMLLIFEFSKASLSTPSSDTNCSVEMRLASIEEQLNRLQSLVLTLKDPLIKEYCQIFFASFGNDDSDKKGYIRTSGRSSEQIFVADQTHRYRGVTLVELDATTCTTRNKQRFDTHASGVDRLQLLETLESASAGTIIVGVTADSAENNGAFQGIAGSFFKRYNMNISGLESRGKFAFIMQKGYPERTHFRISPRFGQSIEMRYILLGSTLSTVTFSRVSYF